MPVVTATVTIQAVGAKGDGLAEVNGKQIFVPYTAPGDVVEITLDESQTHGRVIHMVAPSPDRQSAKCSHFEKCGGCSLQHLKEGVYLAWKRDLIVNALRHRGFDNVDVASVIPIPPKSRRRAVLEWGQCADGEFGLGFHAQKTHQIVDVAECPVVEVAIEQILPKLRAAFREVAPARYQCTVHVTHADNGLDIHLTSKKGELTLDPVMRQQWINALSKASVARLTIDNEIVIQKRKPTIASDGINVSVPVSAFLQATKTSESVLIEYAKKALKKSRRVVDLFCGAGALSLPLSRDMQITGFDSNEGAIAAFTAAANAESGLKFRSAQRRDLERRPLLTDELRAFDGAIIDPPRAGAAAQIRELARSSIHRIVMISCNPATFARDARVLVDVGFELSDLQPVDQFLWSAHVEICGTFVRKK